MTAWDPSPELSQEARERAFKESCPYIAECWRNTVAMKVDPDCAACHDDAGTLFSICNADNLCGCKNELCRACLEEHKTLAQARIRLAMKQSATQQAQSS